MSLGRGSTRFLPSSTARGCHGRLCLTSSPAVLSSGWLRSAGGESVRWFAKPKQRKQKKIIPTAEHLATKGLPPMRLEDRIGNPQSPYEIAKNIRQHISRLTKQDRNQIRRKKDFRRYTLHRMYEFAGLTHTTKPSREIEEENAGMWWGPPTVERNPNRYEGSMEGVTACFKATDVGNRRQANLMSEVVGGKRYDKDTGVIAIRADTFDNRNQNAAYLGDLVELLVRECGSSSPSGLDDDTVTSTVAMKAEEPPPLGAPIRRGRRGRRKVSSGADKAE
ncbi:hypothetical protein FOL47_001871 [Perkinsus chesapeaki]|uniref:Small ribosomal subunit protein mS35 mitochondrial conserved domain-containing protein n=1 Tax=Perkinsus chesapeaki TaxID=330153 RepID=A0A7J6MGF3_PERCH|nr:hypothetical protein FOL47_001871 [Perkinsus chesapeaki]